jgi:glycosyltransferase involved in cell wall biosynthesis
MYEKPLVSVVIPWYNDPYIFRAIESVMVQTYPNIELIVVDDGSSECLDVLEPFMPYITYYHKENGGTASALNLGMTEAQGQYVAWLSSDDLFLPEKVAHQVRFMEQKEAEFSYTDVHYMGENELVYQTNAQIKFASQREMANYAKSGCPINGCTVMMRKNFFDKTGGFAEHLRFTCDYEFWIRVLLSGTRCYFLNEPLTLYRSSPGMDTQLYPQETAQEVQVIQHKYANALNELTNRKRRRWGI